MTVHGLNASWGGNVVLLAATLFGVFVAAGAGFILVAKYLHWHALIVTLVPVTIMAGYALVTVGLRRLRLRDDQTGDNLYYMGFLFTLTSLAMSLYQFSAEGAVEEIIQNFGIAVGSTIAGVLLRVIFSQMRRDPLEVEATARVELSEAARKVRRQLDDTVIELGHFRRSAQQALLDGLAAVSRDVETVTGKLLSNIGHVTARATEPLESASARSRVALDALSATITKTLQSAGQQMASESDRLAANASAVASSLDKVAQKLTAMQMPDRIIEIQVAPVVEALNAAAAGMKSLGERQTADIQHLVSNLKKEYESQAAATRQNLDRATASIAALLPLIGRSTSAVDNQTVATISLCEALQKHPIADREANGEILKTLTSILERLDQLVEISRRKSGTES